MGCVEKLPHSCGSSDALQVFKNHDGTYSGFCFSCSTYVPHPYSDKPVGYKPAKVEKSNEEIQKEIDEVSSFPSVALPTRGLTQETLDHFAVHVALSEADGTTPKIAYFPYQIKGSLRYKARLLEEKRWFGVGSLKEAGLFGWGQAIHNPGKKLFITEGEFDAMALWQVLKARAKGTEWAHLPVSVVSLPAGAGSARTAILGHLNDILSMFQDIVLVFDMDEQGRKAVEEVTKILPKATTVTLPCKDANECLMQGKHEALSTACLFKGAVMKNTKLVLGRSLHEAAREPAVMGLSWPWQAMTDLTRGIRYGETYYIGAGVKMGKSEVVNTLASHFIKAHGIPVFLAKPEESNNKTYKMVASKLVGKIFHDPKVPFDYKAYDEAGALIGDKLYLLDIWQHMGWESLRKDICTAVEAGCKAVFIDPITNMINGIDSGQANTILQGIAQDLSAMAKDLDIVIFIFCHLRAPDGGPPHERGGKVQSYQFSGSRAMMRSCNYMIGIEGDKDPSKPKEQRNLRHIVLLEDREFGETGTFTLHWDENTGLFTEVERE